MEVRRDRVHRRKFHQGSNYRCEAIPLFDAYVRLEILEASHDFLPLIDLSRVPSNRLLPFQVLSCFRQPIFGFELIPTSVEVNF